MVCAAFFPQYLKQHESHLQRDWEEEKKALREMLASNAPIQAVQVGWTCAVWWSLLDTAHCDADAVPPDAEVNSLLIPLPLPSPPDNAHDGRGVQLCV
jgi:hypothetical protein